MISNRIKKQVANYLSLIRLKNSAVMLLLLASLPNTLAQSWCFTDSSGIRQVVHSPRAGYQRCDATLQLSEALQEKLKRYQQGQVIIDVASVNKPKAASIKVRTRMNHTRRWDPIITRYANKYEVDPLLIKAIITVESGFNPSAQSPVGARGLMQIMPKTGKWLAAEMGLPDKHHDLYDPEKNIKLGVFFISRLAKLYNNDLELMLAAYNAGPGVVSRYNNQIPPYQETQDYIQKIKAILSV